LVLPSDQGLNCMIHVWAEFLCGMTLRAIITHNAIATHKLIWKKSNCHITEEWRSIPCTPESMLHKSVSFLSMDSTYKSLFGMTLFLFNSLKSLKVYKMKIFNTALLSLRMV
jgi:hypothetical protein